MLEAWPPVGQSYILRLFQTFGRSTGQDPGSPKGWPMRNELTDYK